MTEPKPEYEVNVSEETWAKVESVEFTGFEIPKQNWSKLPNSFIEHLDIVSSLAELKVILYVLRHTWGFQEFTEFKRITLDEFQNGRKRRDGSRLDRGTGMSTNALRDGIRRAIEDGFLIQIPDLRDAARHSHTYALRMRGAEVEPQRSEVEPQPAKVEPRSEKETVDRNLSNSAAKSAAGEPPSEQLEAVREEADGRGSSGAASLLGDLGIEYKAKHPPVEAAETRKALWLDWGGSAVRARGGTSAAALRLVGWLLEEATTLYPVNGTWRGWLKGLAQMYQAGRGDWEAIKAGIVDAWAREARYRPTHPVGFVGEIQKAWAVREQRPSGRRLVNVRDIPDSEL